MAKYKAVYLSESVLEELEEGRQATNPAMSLEDYIEHLAAMHKAVRQLKAQQEDIDHDEENHR